jgi:hypothetical protein
MLPNKDPQLADSIQAVSKLVNKDGLWKIHFFNFLDAFRRTRNLKLVFLPPVAETEPRFKSLLASMVCESCAEMGLAIPDWANQTYFLDEPWFVAGMESLKAMAIVESPLYFRRNNIFVLDNFMSRA